MAGPALRIGISAIGRTIAGLLVAAALVTPVAAGTVQFAGDVFELRESSLTGYIGVVRTGDTSGPAAVVVDVDPASATAVRGVDFELDLPTGVLDFADRESFKLIPVNAPLDDMPEGTEYARLVLSSPTGADIGSQSALRLLVRERDVTEPTDPNFDFSTGTAARTADTQYAMRFVSVNEGDAVTIDVSYAPAAVAGTVDVTVIGGTAALGADYVEPAGSLNFAAGTEAVSFTLSTVEDSLSEGLESIELLLSNPTPDGAFARTVRALVLIEDDDTPPAGRFRLEHSSMFDARLSVAENEPLTFRVRRVGGASGVVTVDYAALDKGVSVFDRAYVPAVGTLVFGDGVQVQSFAVPLIDDQTRRNTARFRVVLVNATGGAAVDPAAASVEVSVNDDDRAPAGTGCGPGDFGCALANSDCFIATAAYGSYLDPHVAALREFRDRHLLTNTPGRTFVAWYYRVSPPLAELIHRHEALRVATRAALTPIVFAIVHPLSALVLLAGCAACVWARFRYRRTRLPS